MIRALVMANDSLLADGIAAMLAQEINLDVSLLTPPELGKGNHHSVLILVDEGQSGDEFIDVANLFRNHETSLVIMLSLKSQHIYIYESYHLANPEMAQMIHIIREFGKMNLKKNPDDQALAETAGPSLKDMTAIFYSFIFHFLRRKRVSNVTPLTGLRRSSGFDV